MTFVSALDCYFNIESYSVDKTKGIKFSVVRFYDPEHAMLFNQARQPTFRTSFWYELDSRLITRYLLASYAVKSCISCLYAGYWLGGLGYRN